MEHVVYTHVYLENAANYDAMKCSRRCVLRRLVYPR